jgi:predicted MFS family arabinose efflux permease
MSFWRVTFPLSFVNFINQAARAVMALIGPALALEFGLSAADLGLLSAALFVAYCLMQLPVGIALDLHGPRRVQAAAAAVAAVGFAVSALATGPWSLAAGRFLTGLGVASALIGILKAHTAWYPKERVAGLTGIAIFIGSTGGLLVTLPLQAVLPAIGWRGAFWAMAGVAVLVSIAIAVLVPPSPRREAGRPLGEVIRELGPIVASPIFIRMVPAIIVLNGLHFTFQSLWLGPWLRDVAGLDEAARAGTLLVYALGAMAGNLLMGQASTAWQLRGGNAFAVPVLAMFGMLSVQALLLLPGHAGLPVALLWAGFALFGSCASSAYAAVAQCYAPSVAGRVSTAVNAIMLALVFLLQSGIGAVLDLWPRTAGGGWDAAGYSWALTGCFMLQAATVLWMALRSAPGGPDARRATGEPR